MGWVAGYAAHPFPPSMLTILLATLLVGPPAPRLPADVLGLPAHGKSACSKFEWKSNFLVVGLSVAADVVTTELAIKSGAEEANPLLKDRTVRLTLKTLEVPAIVLFTKDIHNTNPGQAHKVKWFVAGIHLALAAWNTRIILLDKSPN